MTKLQQIVLFLFILFIFPVAAFGQTSQDCLACHGDKTLTMEKGGRTISLFADATKLKRSAHNSVECIDCHVGLDPNEIPHARVIKPVRCQSCHEENGYKKSIHAAAQKQRAGKPGKAAAAECKDCHGTHEILPAGDIHSQTSRTHLSKTCGKCHDSAAAHFSKSAHGRALAEGVKGAPACIDCHGEHNVEPVTSKESPVYKTHEAAICESCHLDNPEVRQRVGPSAGFIAAYEKSVHGIALQRGNNGAATCSDCHGAHDMQKWSDVRSPVNRYNIPQTCAKCHAEAAQTYSESIHGKAVLKGNRDSPVCTDCHGEHQILPPTDPRSRVAASNVSTQVCAACHNSVPMTQRYGLPADRFKTFQDSYHGLALTAGSVEVANCASCHGYHDIKPSSDPTSSVNKANLAVTCGKCHPGANENFAKGSIHVVVARDGETVLYWIKTFYISLIVVTIGGMFIHNLFDFVRKAKLRYAIRRGEIKEEAYGPSLYLRMSLSERLQHGALLLSFITLVITGFMLRFPDARWVVIIRQLSESVFEIRSLTHRIAGVVLVTASLYHLYYILFVPRGKRLIRDLLPRLRDLRDARDVALYNFGFSNSKPKLDRFSYVEKAEYWALVWGTVIMAGTGFIMWFDNTSIGLLTKLGWDIARTIHYYEAWLATLAIVVWHFYFVIFNPNVYPMNLAWIRGTLSEAEMAEEHPLELERIQARQLEESIAEGEEEEIKAVFSEQPEEEHQRGK
jgi:cytochrome b subunit of formate dehydrogenase